MYIKNKSVMILILCLVSSFDGISTTHNYSSTLIQRKINQTTQPSKNFFIDNISLRRSDPIFINNNSDFRSEATKRGWTGTGNGSTPITIENIYFLDSYNNESFTSFITISNTNLYFRISRVYFVLAKEINLIPSSRLKVGIVLQNCSNGLIENNFFESNINATPSTQQGGGMLFMLLNNCSNLVVAKNYFNLVPFSSNSDNFTRGLAITINNLDNCAFLNNYFEKTVITSASSFNLFSSNQFGSIINITIMNNHFVNSGLSYTTNSFYYQNSKIFNDIQFNYFENSGIASPYNSFNKIYNNIFNSLNSLYNLPIYIINSNKTAIFNNQIKNSYYGLALTSDPGIFNQTDIQIFSNEFINQTKYAIYITNNTGGNSIYNNNFENNNYNGSGSQVYVGLNQIIPNEFTNGTSGNYWSDYNGSDANNDGFGDIPYIINQNNSDPRPFINPLNLSFSIFDYFNKSYFTNRLKGYSINSITSQTNSSLPTQSNSSSLDLFNIKIEDFLIFDTLYGAFVLSLLAIVEYRKFYNNKLRYGSEKKFTEYLKDKLTKKNLEEHAQLSNDTLDILEEIIEENAEKEK